VKTTLSVALGTRSYDIIVGEGVLAQAGQLLAPLLARPKTVIVTDENVARLHLEALSAALRTARIEPDAVVLPPGETTKSFAWLERLTERLIELKVERRDAIIAFGGGVVGDLTGFAAAIARRGVNYVQIPTTLLAQVDSAVGGKTAIDSRFGKNLIGTFYQPRLVLSDIGLLDSLPLRQRLAGYAEIVKYGLIRDADFFAWLEDHGVGVIEGNAQARTKAILASCRHKAEIVAQDEREEGARALLNLGHTFAHALEIETGYGEELLHGEAVAIGLVLAFELSSMLGRCSGEDAARVRRHLAAVGLPTGLEGLRAFDPDRLLERMAQDKKAVGGRLRFVLVSGIGHAFLDHDVPADAVRALLAREVLA
jgi:3-dehydroquinate synthase